MQYCHLIPIFFLRKVNLCEIVENFIANSSNVKLKLLVMVFHWKLDVFLMNVISSNIGSQYNIDFIGSAYDQH